MNKMLDEYNSNEWSTQTENMILSQAIFAKNSILTGANYSPFMRVFGKELKMIPGLEEEHYQVVDKWVQQRVDSISSARRAVVEAENNMRIHYAMKRQNNCNNEKLSVGDIVKYYRDSLSKEQNGWRGPARILDKIGTEITVKHNNKFISAHKRDVRKIRSQDGEKWGVSEMRIQKKSAIWTPPPISKKTPTNHTM